jgi:hypothetical protein
MYPFIFSSTFFDKAIIFSSPTGFSSYFFFHPRNRKELIMILQSEDFIYPVCIDLKDTFNKLNKFPLNDKFRTFLLDNTNKVILVGNPMHHPRIKEMYMGQLRDCNNKPEVEGDE